MYLLFISLLLTPYARADREQCEHTHGIQIIIKEGIDITLAIISQELFNCDKSKNQRKINVAQIKPFLFSNFSSESIFG